MSGRCLKERDAAEGETNNNNILPSTSSAAARKGVAEEDKERQRKGREREIERIERRAARRRGVRDSQISGKVRYAEKKEGEVEGEKAAKEAKGAYDPSIEAEEIELGEEF